MLFLYYKVRSALVLILLVYSLTSCKKDPCKQLNDQVSEALTDNRITADEAANFLKSIKDPKNEFKRNCSNLRADGGRPDQAALLAFIKNNRTYRKKQNEGETPVVEGLTIANAKPLRAKLYLEASRSMFPYDSPNGQGQFKKALDRLLSPFENAQPGQTKLAIVNDKVYDLNIGYSDFIGRSNLYAHETLLGDSSFTEFELIFRQILADIKKGEVAVLASDLIYSPRDKGASPTKIMEMGAGLMNNLFGPVADKTSLLILQMSADYTGRYYSETARAWVNGPNQRPYYLCLMAHNDTMQRLLADASHHDLEHLPGFRNFWFFSQATQRKAPIYTVLPQKGQYQKHEDEVTDPDKTIHSLEKVAVDPVTKTLTIPVAVDLSKLYLPETVKTNPAQYEIIGPDGFQIKTITAFGSTPGEFNTTHKFLLTTNKLVNNERTVDISMRRTFPPSWVRKSHTDNDSNPDTETTFGLQSFLQGIERAYNPDNQQTYFTIKVSLAP